MNVAVEFCPRRNRLRRSIVFNFFTFSCRVMQRQVRFHVDARLESLLMKSMKKRRRRRREGRKGGRKAELEMRAMGTLHIGRIGMRGRAEAEGRRVFKVHWADGGRGGEREDYFGQRSWRGEKRNRLAEGSGIRKFHDWKDRSIDWSNRRNKL